MEYTFDKTKNKILKKLESKIMEEYDKAPETAVRLNLLPPSHNAFHPEYEKTIDENGTLRITNNPNNKNHTKSLVAIHETTPGKSDGSMPTKPPESEINQAYYEKILFNGSKDKVLPYGDSIGYHAMISSPGIQNKQEITLYLPAICSPYQVGNANFSEYAYGIERLCGDKQDYHLAVANQAMLTAFVLREMGYDKEAAMRHFMPHHFFAKPDKNGNKKACPARMMYASELLKKEEPLTPEELKIMEEYVPWEVFSNLVLNFFERNKYPEQLEEKFIWDMEDYHAYMENPETYNYAERKKLKQKDNSVEPHNIELKNDKVSPINEFKEKLKLKYYSQLKDENKTPEEPPKINPDIVKQYRSEH